MPPGQAPEEVRREWIGAVMPLLSKQNTLGFESGVLGGEPDIRNIGGYRVDPDEAICALVEKNTKASNAAAQWWIHWRENTPWGQCCNALVFNKEVCEVIP
ncbi:MAG: hypothetical protein WC798_00955 [Candidatus Paceibacterota bacterium]